MKNETTQQRTARINANVKIGIVSHEYRGTVDEDTGAHFADWTSAGECSDCSNAIVHIYTMKDGRTLGACCAGAKAVQLAKALDKGATLPKLLAKMIDWEKDRCPLLAQVKAEKRAAWYPKPVFALLKFVRQDGQIRFLGTVDARETAALISRGWSIV